MVTLPMLALPCKGGGMVLGKQGRKYDPARVAVGLLLAAAGILIILAFVLAYSDVGR